MEKHYRKYLSKIQKRLDLLEYKKDCSNTSRQLENILDEIRVLGTMEHFIYVELEKMKCLKIQQI